MKYLSLFSGIEAASLAWEPLVWGPMAFCEIEPFPSAVLAHHWPHVPNLGDVTAVDWEAWLKENGTPDVIVAGAPCQAFSVAGTRRSLEDARGNLTLFTAELVRLIRPKFFLFENVPGLLSSRDNAFGCFLGELVGAGEALKPTGKRWTDAGLVSGPEASGCWRVFDAQYFEVAQRRARLFLVVCPREGADPAQVLLEPESLFGDPAPRRKTRAQAASGPAGGSGERGVLADSGVVRGLKARFGTSGADLDDAEAGHLVPDTTVMACSHYNAEIATDLCTTLSARQYKDPPIAFSCKDSGQDAGEVSPTLRAMSESPGVSFNGGGQVAVAFPVVGFNSQRGQNLDLATTEDATPPITSKERVAVAYRKSGRPHGPEGSGLEGESWADDDVANTLNAYENHNATRTTHAVVEAQIFTGDGETADPIGANEARTYTNEGAHNFRLHNCVADEPLAPAPTMAVRRLTPRECERLQGMPDDHTRIPWRGKAAEDCPDGPRYKAIGNSMAVPVIRWIGRRMEKEGERWSR